MDWSEYVGLQGSFCGAVDTRVGEFDLRAVDGSILAFDAGLPLLIQLWSAGNVV